MMRKPSPAGLLAVIWVFVLAPVLSGCQALPPQNLTPAAYQPTPTAAADTLTPPTTAARVDQPVLLRLWLPPQFDPAAPPPAGELLRARLERFAAMHPGLKME